MDKNSKDENLSELMDEMETDSYDKKYKKLQYKDHVFLYKVRYRDTGYGYDIETNIYDYVPVVKTVKKYRFFGKKIQKKTHKLLFTIHYDIESANKTKEDVRKSVDQYLDLKKREEELKNGIII